MRIRPPEFETSICDAKYHVSLAPHFDPFADLLGVIRRRDWVRCSCAKDSADALCVDNQSQDTSWKHMFNTSWTTRRKQQQHPVVNYNEPAVAIYPVASYSGSSRELQCYCLSSRLGTQTQEKKK
ncbi:NAC transcription factor 29-like [Dorcoceras hygrometricum]|uniref:NAC transcription factor 29-like n=1 Tax=Dorcoceras hygrometricum TaxID=472368 RepID=A0A2Z7CH22_9LAMI|nr:NAC transcription factor 29-like [Dorcoceras hygrometricum]